MAYGGASCRVRLWTCVPRCGGGRQKGFALRHPTRIIASIERTRLRSTFQLSIEIQPLVSRRDSADDGDDETSFPVSVEEREVLSPWNNR